LRSPALDDEQWRLAAAHALEWLETKHETTHLDFAINSLTTRPALVSTAQWQRLLHHAQRWLESEPGEPESNSLIRTLLRAAHETVHQGAVYRFVKAWMMRTA
jgi:hypothetical protein